MLESISCYTAFSYHTAHGNHASPPQGNLSSSESPQKRPPATETIQPYHVLQVHSEPNQRPSETRHQESVNVRRTRFFTVQYINPKDRVMLITAQSCFETNE